MLPWAPSGFFFQERANGEPRPEGQRRGGVLGEGSVNRRPLTISYGVCGRALSSASGVRDGAPAQIDFCTFFGISKTQCLKSFDTYNVCLKPISESLSIYSSQEMTSK